MADYQILSSDDGKILSGDTSVETVSFQLPSPTAGFKVTIKDVGGCAGLVPIQILRFGNELIDGAAFDIKLDHSGGTISLVSDGTNWMRFDGLIRANIQTAGLGVFTGGRNSGGTALAVSEYIEMWTLASSYNFSALTLAKRSHMAAGNRVRMMTAGDTSNSAVIDSSLFSTKAVFTSFGTLAHGRGTGAGCANQVRMLCGGGGGGGLGGNTTNVEAILMASAGNGADYATLTVSRDTISAFSTPTRGFYAGGGQAGTPLNTIDSVGFMSGGIGASWGTLTGTRLLCASTSNSVRGLIGGGFTGAESSQIDFITFATQGNAVSFGQLTSVRQDPSACASHTRAVWAGGGATPVSSIEYVTIALQSSAQAFGDLYNLARLSMAGGSNCHGGLYV